MGDSVRAIHYGMFIMPYHDPAKALGQCCDEDLELIVRAEELGFSEFWIGEHHTMKYENIVMPEIFIARALGETRRIRLGPAPVCLNQHHPAHVAGRLAFLDHLSKGRHLLVRGRLGARARQGRQEARPRAPEQVLAPAADRPVSCAAPSLGLPQGDFFLRYRPGIFTSIFLHSYHFPHTKPTVERS